MQEPKVGRMSSEGSISYQPNLKVAKGDKVMESITPQSNEGEFTARDLY